MGEGHRVLQTARSIMFPEEEEEKVGEGEAIADGGRCSSAGGGGR